MRFLKLIVYLIIIIGIFLTNIIYANNIENDKKQINAKRLEELKIKTRNVFNIQNINISSDNKSLSVDENNKDIKLEKKLLENVSNFKVENNLDYNKQDLETKELSLLDCIEIAKKCNLQILESLRNLNSQQYKILQAKSPLKLQSSINSKSSWQKSEISSKTGSTNSSLSTYGASINLSQVIYDSGKYTTGINIAETNYEILVLNHEKLFLDTLLKVCENYYNLAVAIKLEKVAQKAYENALLHQMQAEANFNVGLSQKTDFIRAQTNTFEQKYNLISAHNTLQKAKLALNYVLGFYKDDIAINEELKCDTIGIELNSAIDKAINNRAEIIAAKQNIKSYELQIKQAKAELLPQINLGANAGIDYDNSALKNEKSSYLITATLSLPLKNGNLTQNKINELNEKIKSLEYNLKQMELNIKYDVTYAYLNLVEAYEKIETALKNVEYAKSTLELVNEQYKVGLVTMIDVIDAELAYNRAMTNLIQSQGNFLIAKCRFKRNIGDDEFYK